jgi:hypothetical protein
MANRTSDSTVDDDAFHDRQTVGSLASARRVSRNHPELRRAPDEISLNVAYPRPASAAVKRRFGA